MSPPPLQEMWLACPGVIKENHSEYCSGVLPSIQGKVGVEGYPVNVIIIHQEMSLSKEETLQQLWKKQALYIFQPSCTYLCQVLFLWHHYDPPRRAPPPYQHIRIGTHSSGRTYNAMCLGGEHC